MDLDMDHTSSHARHGKALLVLVVIATIAALVWYFFVPQVDQVDDSNAPALILNDDTPLSINERPVGRIYATLLPFSGGRFTPYVLDLTQGTLTQGELQGDLVTLHHAFSGNTVSYVATTVDEYDYGSEDIHSLFQLYTSAVNEQEHFPSGGAVRVTDVSQPLKRLPDIAPSGRAVLYTAKEERADTVLSLAEEWAVYIAQQGQAPTKVTEGTFPKWLNDNEFVYLKNDGIYVYDVAVGTSRQVARAASGAFSNMALHVSEDRSTLAWNVPNEGLLFIYDIRRDGDGAVYLTRTRTIERHGFWPVLSPNGRFVALQAVNWETLTTDPQPQLELYSVGTGQRVLGALDLQDFDQERMFITDWRN